MSQDATVKTTDLDISGEFGEEIMFEEVEARLETLTTCCFWVADTHDGMSDCCGAGTWKPNCSNTRDDICIPEQL